MTTAQVRAINDKNREICLDFTQKAKQFLGLPKSLMGCMKEKRNPDLVTKRDMNRALKSLKLIKEAEKTLNKLEKIFSK